MKNQNENELNAALAEADAQFNYNEADQTWCLSGVTAEGTGWETDDYEAASLEEAQADAVDYLIAYNDPIV